MKMLSDSNTYEVIRKDLTKRLTEEVIYWQLTWENKEYIDLHTYRTLKNFDYRRFVAQRATGCLRYIKRVIYFE